MKVLCLFQYMDGIGRPARGSDRLIRGATKLGGLCDFKMLMLDDLRRKIKVGYTGMDLQDEYKPSALMCYGNFAEEILNGFFRTVTCAKTVVITDFHDHIKNHRGILEAYKKSGFEIMFMRGVYKKGIGSIPMVWIPFSADEKEFYPDPKLKRKNLISFAGYTASNVYGTRRRAVKLLRRAKLIDICPKEICNKIGIVGDTGYSRFLRSYVAGLTSTELYDFPLSPRAKMFEMMGSETMVLTPTFMGIEEILGRPEECYIEYRTDCADVVQKAKWIINHIEEARMLAKQGRQLFLEKHTDSKRAEDFYWYLSRLVEGKPLERLYGWEGR